MKNLILVALILQLVITVNVINATFEFGDILAFLRACGRKEGVYKHYAIYVGPSNETDVGQGDNDIFHLKVCIGPVCQYQFDTLEATKGDSPVEVENYFDTTDGMGPGTREEIMKRIKDSKGNCQLYGPLNKNCEHFATWVRYDKPTAKQSGTFVEPIFRLNAFVREIMAELSRHFMNELLCFLAG
ncbi:phospholipase A and acyltransferase 1-like [Epinephelus fuscoguttatus]|uniref:phospholipase A and acyltransferase 1-like n=1 Tax=Epinephelus fuscoguttatus TaxID=293821 RepID=UPI0020D1B684|nr:phospholipase A and acyltransferase 1-like [Epinephelus fuscoguttatus]